MASDPLPPDDGSIEQALAEVNAKLAVWSDAMNRAQTALSGTAEPGSSPGAEAQTAQDRAAQAHLVKTREPKSSPRECPDPRDTGGEGLDPQAADEPEDSSLCGPEQPAQPPAEDDEALLQSLDTETANAIRIQRRLSPNKRSVRELLEEYEATRSSTAVTGEGKRSWWTRR